jgi:hypothetical protein
MSAKNKYLLKQLLWSSLAGLIFGIWVFIVASLFLQKIPANLKILEYTAPIAAFSAGVFLWQLLISRSKKITLWKGMWVGALISLIAHLFAWYFGMFYSSISGEHTLKDLTFFQYLWVGLINALTSVIIVGWITVPGGSFIGCILASLQGIGLKKGIEHKKIIKNKKKALIVLIAIALFSVACIHTDGPYRGKVVELETGKPIEGAVVAAEWRILVFTHTEPFCDARETLTDKNGEFVLPNGSCINHPLAEMYKPRVVVFKPGYLGYLPLGNNPEEKRAYMPSFTGHEFQDEKQYYIIKLGRPTTREEREMRYGDAGFSDEETYEKLPILLRLLKEERKNLGFPTSED